MSAKTLWIAAITLTLLIGGYLGFVLLANTPWAVAKRTVFLPGNTTQGHYQIELACSACHKPFQGTPQKTCLNCHGEALKLADDAHARHKFADPRNAATLAHIDALHCATCHKEHKPELVRDLDVTVPDDFCFSCHSDIAKERPSHQDFDPKNCASGGCHNYHDEKALYEDFLTAHLHEQDTQLTALLPSRNQSEQTIISKPKAPLGESDGDAPSQVQLPASQLKAWVDSAHGRAGVNCSDCHQGKSAAGALQPWKNQLDHKTCETCHEQESKGFLGGKHGMRLSQGLPAMRPAMARLPMNPDAHDKSLSCAACHDTHAFDTRRAAVEACLGCHADEHSKGYKQSAHFRRWQDEIDGKLEAGSGVSCASCHLPRIAARKDGRTETHVQHNQSMNLHPNEKMVRGVCMQCHGLGFSLDALADESLLRNNFNGRPKAHVKSLDMVEERLRLKAERKTDQQKNRMP